MAMSAVLKSGSVKGRVSKEEWQLRTDLAAAQFERPGRPSP